MTAFSRKRLGLFFARALFLAACAVFAQTVVASVPGRINYQGYLTDAASQPINSTVSIIFRLYDAQTGGNQLWSETQSVSVGNGSFNVQLGSITPFALPFDNPYYLGIQVGADAEMQPRLALASSGYAIQAGSALRLSCAGCVTAANLAPGVLTPGPSGLNGLIATANEPVGTNCANGGIKVNSGLDANNNGALDPGEITSIRYVCNASPFNVVAVPAGCTSTATSWTSSCACATRRSRTTCSWSSMR